MCINDFHIESISFPPRIKLPWESSILVIEGGHIQPIHITHIYTHKPAPQSFLLATLTSLC